VLLLLPVSWKERRRRGGCLPGWVNVLPVAKPGDGGEWRNRGKDKEAAQLPCAVEMAMTDEPNQ
jgi:hypothetical protein